MEAQPPVLAADRRLLPIVLGAFAIAAVAAAALGFAPPAATRVALYVAWGPALVAVGVVAALLLGTVIALRAARTNRAGARIPDLVAIAALVASYALVLGATQPRMRVQSDEATLVATSLALARDTSPVAAWSGVFDRDGVLHPATAAPDARGVLFPMAVAALHRAVGYAPSNAYVVNAALGLGVLLLLYAGVRRDAGPAIALAAAGLLLAQPLFGWSVASAGFDIAALFCLAAVWCAAQAAVASAQLSRIGLLAVLGALAAATRVEAVLTGALAVGCALVLLARAPVRPGHTLIAAVVPLMFLPFAWQRAIPYGHMLDYIGAERAFDLGYLGPHLAALGRFLAARSDYQPLGVALPLLATGGVAVAIARRAAPGLAHATALAAVAACTIATLLYAWGDANYSSCPRLFLPLIAVLGVLAARGLGGLPLPEPARAGLAIAVAAAALGAGIGPLRADAYSRMLPLGMAQDAALGVLRAHPSCRRPLVVERFTTYWVDHGYSALDADELGANWPAVRALAATGAIDAIVLVRPEWEIGGRAFDPATPLAVPDPPPGFAARLIDRVDPTPAIRVAVYALVHPELPQLGVCR